MLLFQTECIRNSFHILMFFSTIASAQKLYRWFSNVIKIVLTSYIQKELSLICNLYEWTKTVQTPANWIVEIGDPHLIKLATVSVHKYILNYCSDTYCLIITKTCFNVFSLNLSRINGWPNCPPCWQPFSLRWWTREWETSSNISATRFHDKRAVVIL